MCVCTTYNGSSNLYNTTHLHHQIFDHLLHHFLDHLLQKSCILCCGNCVKWYKFEWYTMYLHTSMCRCKSHLHNSMCKTHYILVYVFYAQTYTAREDRNINNSESKRYLIFCLYDNEDNCIRQSHLSLGIAVGTPSFSINIFRMKKKPVSKRCHCVV